MGTFGKCPPFSPTHVRLPASGNRTKAKPNRLMAPEVIKAKSAVVPYRAYFVTPSSWRRQVRQWLPARSLRHGSVGVAPREQKMAARHQGADLTGAGAATPYRRITIPVGKFSSPAAGAHEPRDRNGRSAPCQVPMAGKLFSIVGSDLSLDYDCVYFVSVVGNLGGLHRDRHRPPAAVHQSASSAGATVR
jgi:hypothetical protein